MHLSGAGRGLRVAGARPLMMNALPFAYSELYRRPPGTWKWTDIKFGERGTLLVDAAQWGVGGDNQWSELGWPLPKYRTRVESTSFEICLSSTDGTAHPGARAGGNPWFGPHGPSERTPAMSLRRC